MVFVRYLGEATFMHATLAFLIGLVFWLYILGELYFGRMDDVVRGSTGDHLRRGYFWLRLIVTVGWAIYPLGNFLTAFAGIVDDGSLSVAYNLADILNRMAFGVAVLATGSARQRGARAMPDYQPVPATPAHSKEDTSMKGADVIAIIILAAIVIAVAAYLLHWLYRRSTKDVSFVRTGFGGEKVVMGGGALVLPILHDLTEVNMNTLRLEVTRAREKSLITKDRMRVELTVEFYVRVSPNVEAVATAARVARQPHDECRAAEGPDPGPVRRCHGRGRREDDARTYPRKSPGLRPEVKQEVAESLALDGLELESVSLTSLDQTDIKLFDPSNTFDAEGLTRLTEQIESRKKKRNDIEKDTAVAMRAKNLEAEKRSLEIERDSEYARLAHEAEVSIERAQTQVRDRHRKCRCANARSKP